MNANGSNVQFKEIRKKFENLLCADTHSVDIDQQQPPVPPARKNRNSIYQNVNRLSKPLVSSNNGTNQENSVCSPENLVSVKDRTKLFESSASDIDQKSLFRSSFRSSKIVASNDKFPQMLDLAVLNNDSNLNTASRKISSEKTSSHNSSIPLVVPPTKPPRVFVASEKNISTQIRSKSVSNAEVKKQSVEYETPKGVGRSNRLMSVPDVKPYVLNNIETNKITSTKPHGIRSCLKNLSSTATHLKEKMKQSKFFIDLTPTTISPPKHYETLKRSRSEEHIYAELNIANQATKQIKDSVQNGNELHYMCTPIFESKGSKMKEEEKSPSRQSVRDMIYHSFATLRVPKDNPVTKSSLVDSHDSDISMKAIEDRIIYVKSIRQISGSSICIAQKLYEVLWIINIVNDQPEVSYTFPLKIPEEFKFRLLPHICFPDVEMFKPVSVYQSETFHFSLFDKDEKCYGYCLRIMGWPENSSGSSPLCVKLPVAICILSRFHAPLFFSKLLVEVEKQLTLDRKKCFKYIRCLQKLGMPNAGASLSIPDFLETSEDERFVISRPLDSHSVGLELTRALQLLDVGVLVKAVASLLLERKVLFFSSSSSNLYHCCKAISSLLYPFVWPHMFIPVLPSCLIVHCCADWPYIIGLLSTNYDSVLELLAEQDLLVIDIDKGAIVKSCNDEDTILPRRVQKAVITALNLAKNMTDPTEMMRDFMISEAFVHMFVEMIGDYENHLMEQPDGPAFQKEAFVKSAISYSVQMFLQWFSETQMFDSFINEVIWRTRYRKMCPSAPRTFFEKRIDEYKWELTHNHEKFSQMIGKTVRNFGEMIKHKLKK